MATDSGGAPKHGAHFSSDSNTRASARRETGRAPRFRTKEKRGSRKATYMASPRVSSSTAQVTQRAASNVGRHAFTTGPVHRERRFTGILAAIFIVAALVGGGVYGWRLLNASSQGDGDVEAGQEVIVTIPEGAGGAQIAQLLVDAGVAPSTSEFLREVQAQDADSSMKSGTYRFVTGGNLKEVVHQLVLGPNSTEHQVTISEGLTVARTAEVVEAGLGISAGEFVEQAKASNYVGDYAFLADAADDSLEGFLYPKTYDLGGKDVTADTVIRLMLDQYQAEVVPLDLASGAARISETYGVSLSAYDVLKVASIIEREAASAEDRPLIASVLYNRMRDGMRLQSDATMGYVTGGEVTPADLQTESPYNTYLNDGLTPTPICNPSLDSIRAAMEPASTDYYYFLIIETDSYSNHTFSETYEQHQEAIAQAQADQIG